MPLTIGQYVDQYAADQNTIKARCRAIRNLPPRHCDACGDEGCPLCPPGAPTQLETPAAESADAR